MKRFTNLAGNLRAVFSFLRFITVVMAAFWLLMFTFNVWIQRHYTDKPRVAFTFGEGYLLTEPNAVALSSDGARPGSLGLVNLRGALQVDLCSSDAALASAVLWSVVPVLAVATVFLWSLFDSLRSMCANIERGEVFSVRNLLLVRRIGWIFIGNSLVGFGTALWAAHLLGGYLSRHVALTGLKAGLQFPGGLGAVSFALPSDAIPFAGLGGLVIGCLVLVLSEAFRQGLELKAENDLTV
jgi:hypothetical protein